MNSVVKPQPHGGVHGEEFGLAGVHPFNTLALATGPCFATK